MNSVLQKLDLAALAEGIEFPYRPIPLATIGSIDLSLFICEGPPSWHRQPSHNETLFVLEGVITLEGPAGRLVVNEGEVASIPGAFEHNENSGMRSTVLLFREGPFDEAINGHPHTPPIVASGTLGKLNVAANVRTLRPFEWLAAGTTGAYTLVASRLSGASAPYVTPQGSLLVLVYRGVLDYESDLESGTIVGSQMLVVPTRTDLRLRSESGATVILLTRRGAPLPEPSTAGSGRADADATP
jgi:redox-sensitive bicupin YhaK (pirin superfamily)